MAMPQPASSPPSTVARPARPRLSWLLWIVATVIGAVLGAFAGWFVRSLAGGIGASLTQQIAAFVAAVVGASIVAAAQWFVLRRYRVDAYWWIPASVLGVIIGAVAVIPAVTRLAIAQGVTPGSVDRVVIFGAVALASSGLVVGTAQAIVLRRSAGNLAWVWVLATVVGGALAGAVTTALSTTLLSAMWIYALPAFALVCLASAIGALCSCLGQAAVLPRLLR